MKVGLIEGATLVDLLWVCNNLSEDERDQWRAFGGVPYDADNAAAMFYLRPGPKWTVLVGNEAVLVAGFDRVRDGVWQDWALTSPKAWEPGNWRPVTRLARKVMDWMLQNGAHRLQCVSLASRIQAHRWYRPLGLELEGTLRAYGVNGEDALMFSRLRAT